MDRAGRGVHQLLHRLLRGRRLRRQRAPVNKTHYDAS
jgi:hypothetical protein